MIWTFLHNKYPLIVFFYKFYLESGFKKPFIPSKIIKRGFCLKRQLSLVPVSTNNRPLACTVSFKNKNKQTKKKKKPKQ